MFGGDFAYFNVTAGETYTWTTCGAASFDTQLTLFQGLGCGGAVLGYNDDDCGLQSTITWTATFTGQVTVLVSQFFCATNSICQQLDWACVSCGSSAITTCSDTFYDTGGPLGNYSNNQNYSVTYCPAVAGQCIRAEFTSFSLENSWDYLDVYDGSNTGAPLLQSATGTQLNGVTVQANNASGCLTFNFDSDFSNTDAGWAANITCVDCADPPPAAPQDCNGGITICSDVTFNGNSSGPGVQELNGSNQGCLAFENESTWFFFSPQATGTIAFMLEPNPVVDYDFAVWGPYPSPTCPPPGPPLRCSWSAALTDTGLQTGAGDNSEGAGGDALVNPITVGPGDIGQVYILFIDNWTASTTPYTFNWDLTGVTLDCTVLPVELLDLGVERTASGNRVHWETASETNSDYFDVERSHDGQDYKQIGRVAAAGNTNAPRSYAFIDPYNGDGYYRLKQVDFDGQFEYFGPVVIVSDNSGLVVHQPYPNPLNDGLLFVDLELPVGITVKTTVTDMTGRTLLEVTERLERGPQQIQLDLSALAPGSYEIQLSDDNAVVLHQSRIVK